MFNAIPALRHRVSAAFHAHAPEALVVRWMLHRFYAREADARVAFEWVRNPDAIAVDVGANRGIIARVLARHFAQVFAFEPDPNNLAFLRRNPPPRTKLHEVALSDSAGEATFKVPIWGGRPSRSHGSLSKEFDQFETEDHTVERRTLDSYDLHGVGLMKIDVEGHELEVLRGAAETLDREHPAVWIEVERLHGGGDGHPAAVFEILEGHGYHGYFWHRGVRHGVSDFDLQRHQPDTTDGNVSPERVTNFLFVRDD